MVRTCPSRAKCEAGGRMVRPAKCGTPPPSADPRLTTRNRAPPTNPVWQVWHVQRGTWRVPYRRLPKRRSS
eukprot:2435014-Prymnesium_polylepis.2